MESFWNDLYYEDIHFRDNLQFELQSDFAPLAALKENISTQEFYFFIPSALQINKFTYSKEQFYKDRTNLIRYKTPEFTLLELVDKKNRQSPLTRIASLKNASQTKQNELTVQDELKLLGNVVRSALRVSVRRLFEYMKPPVRNVTREQLETTALSFCTDIQTFRNAYLAVHNAFLSHWSGPSRYSFLYVDEFISNCIDYYLTGFLTYLRQSKIENVHLIERRVCELIVQEKKHRHKCYQEVEESDLDEIAQENVLYHKGFLNKYVWDALLLGFERVSWVDKYGHIIGGLAAGIAMLLYALLLFLNVQNVGLNTLPFVLLTVVLYVLKDRIKDWLKTLFHQKAAKWFSDYTTDIKGVSSEKSIGQLKEFFSFVKEEEVPEDIRHIRDTQFEGELPLFHPPEELFYYKKEMVFPSREGVFRPRRHKLHTIFLFNIHLLLEKASNPIEPSFALDPHTMEVNTYQMPKIYYINIIMKNTYMQPDLQKKVELKKFRMVIDKTGMKRIETVH